VTVRLPRILIVTFLFPPFAGIGSVRLGKLATYLAGHGWEVRVLAAKAHVPRNLAQEFPPENVTYANWFEVDRILDFIRNPFGRRRLALMNTADTSLPVTSAAGKSRLSRFRAALRNAIFEFVRVPDRYVGWLPDAIRQGDRILDTWKPDLIYASAPPYSALLVGRRLARRHGLPWVAEFRDPWTDNPYYEFTGLRRRIEAIWERRVLASTVGVVGVTPAWVDRLAARTGKPAELVMNGFVVSDFPRAPPLSPSREGPLHILYTGALYDGLRDPTPLFLALASLGAARINVRITFVGDAGNVLDLARRFDIEQQVEIRPPVSYRESLDLQCQADVLLNLQSDNRQESGWIPAKIFEYLAARRPILSVGYESGEVPSIIRDRRAGIVALRPQAIADQLKRWIAEKGSGGISPTPESATEGFAREEQFAKLDRFLRARLAERGRT